MGLRGRLRLLTGMVRANRPWRLVPQLSSATAAAVATAAYACVTVSFWQMAAALSPTRLILINLLAVGAMTVWLIAYNRLWDRPADPAERVKAVLYNAVTVLTLLVGVVCMNMLLFLVMLVAAAALIDPGYLAQTVHQHEPSYPPTRTTMSSPRRRPSGGRPRPSQARSWPCPPAR